MHDKTRPNRHQATRNEQRRSNGDYTGHYDRSDLFILAHPIAEGFEERFDAVGVDRDENQGGYTDADDQQSGNEVARSAAFTGCLRCWWLYLIFLSLRRPFG